MALPTGYLISGALGLAMGSALTGWVTNDSETTPGEPMKASAPAPALSRPELKAAIATDPSLSGRADLEAPTAEEAQAAFRKAKRETFPEVTLTIGQCDRDTIGPGVACMSRIVWGPDGEPAERLVGFSRSPDGWVAWRHFTERVKSRLFLPEERGQLAFERFNASSNLGSFRRT